MNCIAYLQPKLMDPIWAGNLPVWFLSHLILHILQFTFVTPRFFWAVEGHDHSTAVVHMELLDSDGHKEYYVEN
ncbi:Hypothetical predicted protein [Octopus vulgaris]|uniref:Uncharacterized protein n=1 Tax=Octopus vulgaris TaxID=6645 RepID=A0AA36FD37_OCTVU|nr:Hypothetical predicted protein [Octopus vulgaris]